MTLHLAALVHAASTTTTVAHSSHPGPSILDPINKVIANVLAGIYSVIPDFGVAIIVLSLVWMIIISPLTLKSTRSMLAMQKLQPQLKKLQEQHKNDRQAFAQAQMDLFREHQVSPFGSCLPMILPLPVFFALFRVIDGLSHRVDGAAAPKYLSHHTAMYKAIVAGHGKIVAFGMDLSKNALSGHNGILAALPFWILLLVMAGTSYFQSAQMMSRNQAAQNNPQMRMMKYLPLLFVVLCIRFPAGVVLYYTTSNLCRIIQQDFMYRFDPKVKKLVAQEVIEVQEITREIDEGNPKRGPGYTPPRGAKPSPTEGGRGGSGAQSGGGRSRFRDLLAAAAEQQKAQQQQKSGQQPKGAQQPKGRSQPSQSQSGQSSKAGRSGTGGSGGGQKALPKGAGNGSRSGSASNGGGPNRNRSNQGSRTNRRRRGR